MMIRSDGDDVCDDERNVELLTTTLSIRTKYSRCYFAAHAVLAHAAAAVEMMIVVLVACWEALLLHHHNQTPPKEKFQISYYPKYPKSH